MAVGVMVIKVRASVGVRGSSNSVYKGNDCEPDGCAVHSSSSEADRGRWLRGSFSNADGSEDDCRGDCCRGDGYRG